MAFAATTVWEVETTGSDNNGGGFNPSETSAGTDYTYGAGQTTISWLTSGGTYTNDLASTTGTKVISSGSRNFIAADVGNFIHISAGTHFTPGWYEIKSVAANKATLDRDPTDGSTASVGSGYLGGALASPAIATSLLVSGNMVWIKSGTYTISSASTNVAGGVPLLSVAGNASQLVRVEGYQSTRGDLGTKPILQPNLTVSYIFGVTSTYTCVRNLTFNGTVSNYATNGYYNSEQTSSLVEFCTAQNCTGYGLSSTTGQGEYLGCLVSACANGILGLSSIFCEVYGCTSSSNYAFSLGSRAYGCIASGNSCIGIYAVTAIGCTSYGNASHGFYINSVGMFVDCYAEGNGTTGTVYGFYFVSNDVSDMINCSGYNNYGVSGNGANYNTFTEQRIINFIALGSTAFVSAGTGNFYLNNNATGGALLRAAGYPSTFPRGTTANYRDIGASQSGVQVGTVG